MKKWVFAALATSVVMMGSGVAEAAVSKTWYSELIYGFTPGTGWTYYANLSVRDTKANATTTVTHNPVNLLTSKVTVVNKDGSSYSGYSEGRNTTSSGIASVTAKSTEVGTRFDGEHYIYNAYAAVYLEWKRNTYYYF